MYISVLKCSCGGHKKRQKKEKVKRSSRQTLFCPCSCPPWYCWLISPQDSSLWPIRDHKAYHDGSVYIYQQNTEQKTQMCLCVQQSTPTESERSVRQLGYKLVCLYGVESLVFKVDKRCVNYYEVNPSLIIFFLQVTELILLLSSWTFFACLLSCGGYLFHSRQSDLL